MTPRTITTAVAGVLVVLLAAVGALLPVPYVAVEPGPTANALGEVKGRDVISISGRQTYPTKGNLEVTTIYVTGGPTRSPDLVTALLGWLDPDVAVVPQEYYYPPDQTGDEIRQENAEEMELSQEYAKAAALRQLGIPVESTVVVQSIAKTSPALGKLKAGDRILEVDGKPARTPEQVRELIVDREPGDDVTLTVRRAERTQTIRVTTTKAEDGRPVVGFIPAESFDYPFEIDIRLEDIGGPSAGLMFALAIVDKLTPGALTGGKYIAGTGTIEPDGTVGPIGGIQQKIAAAREAGADAFLVPAGNCPAAALVEDPGVRLVKVDTLEAAVSAIEAIREGGPAPDTCAA